MIIYSTSESDSTVCWHQLSTSDREQSDVFWGGLEYGGYSFYMELVLQICTYRKEGVLGVQEATALKSTPRTSQERP